MLKRQDRSRKINQEQAAAFGRLCVETSPFKIKRRRMPQPPSGGCVLKLANMPIAVAELWQPPSGGCVLKHKPCKLKKLLTTAAAFGRLCVETLKVIAL